MCAAGRTHILGHPKRLPQPQMTRKYRPHHDVPRQTFSNIKALLLSAFGNSYPERRRGGDVGLQFNLDKKSFARPILGAALIEEV